MTHDPQLFTAGMHYLLSDIGVWSAASGRALRAYQAECARAILSSVVGQEGRTYTVMFARQMGKNETSAQLEAYLLRLYAERGGIIVKAAPSFKPQIITSMLRLKAVLNAHPLTRGQWQPAYSYMVRLDKSQISFFRAQ